MPDQTFDLNAAAKRFWLTHAIKIAATTRSAIPAGQEVGALQMQADIVRHPAGSTRPGERHMKLKQDTRTTRQAHETRNMVNKKPYRSGELKQEAREKAKVYTDGAIRSETRVMCHGR